MAEPKSTHEVAETTKHTSDGGVVKERTETVTASDGTTKTAKSEEGAKQIKPDGR